MSNSENAGPDAGNETMFPAGPPQWPRSDQRIRQALISAWDSGSWGKYQGEHIPQLELKLSEMHDGRWVQCCSSGTVAVELALHALALQEGDRVLLAGYDFPGNFSAIEAVGATPVLVDITPQTWTVSADQLNTAIREYSPKAAIISHLHGGLAPMRDIMTVADKHGVMIIEDFCQCPGAVVDGRTAGTWGRLSVTSFGGSKLLTAGRGGAVLGVEPLLAQRIRIYNDRGNQRFPLSELQAAVLLPQLDDLAEQNRHRQRQVETLIDGLSDLPTLQPVDTARSTDRAPAYYKLAFQCDRSSLPRWVAGLRSQGVAPDEGFRGFVRRRGRRCLASGELTGTQLAADTTLILHHPILAGSDQQIERLTRAFRIVHDLL